MDQVSLLEAAHILGLTPKQAQNFLSNYDLVEGAHTSATIEQLEHLAMDIYPRGRHQRGDDRSYWLNCEQAAEVLGLSRQRVQQLLDADRLPHERHRSGSRLMRRAQIELIANAREARRLQV